MNSDNKKIVIMHLRSSQRTSSVLFGGESIVLDICRFLNRDKFQPIIVALRDRGATDNLPLVNEAKKYRLSAETIFLKHPFDLAAISKLKELLEQYKVNILHCHEYKSDLIGFLATRKKKSVKLISTIHGYTGGSIKLKIYEYIDRCILRYFDRIIAVSAFVEDLLRKAGYSTKTLTISNAIDIEKFEIEINKSIIKKKLNISDKTLVIGTIGRLSPEKGHYYFLKAAKEVIKEHPNTIFLIIGDGPSKRRLERFVSKAAMENNVIFTGFRNDISKLLSIIDIFVMPSIREAFGLSILEAMLAGKAIIATNVGGIPSIIKDKQNGILVNSRSSEVLAKAIIDLSKNENLRIELGREAKNYVKSKFSVGEMVKNYENIYLEVANRKV